MPESACLLTFEVHADEPILSLALEPEVLAHDGVEVLILRHCVRVEVLNWAVVEVPAIKLLFGGNL